MKLVTILLVSLATVLTIQAKEIGASGGTVRFFLDLYSAYSNKALIVEAGIQDMNAAFTVKAEEERFPEKISLELLARFGIRILPVNDVFCVVVYSNEEKYSKQVAEAQDAARNHDSSLPSVIVGAHYRLEYLWAGRNNNVKRMIEQNSLND